MFLVHFPYLYVDFGLRGTIFGAKDYVFGTFVISLEPLGAQCSYLNPR